MQIIGYLMLRRNEKKRSAGECVKLCLKNDMNNSILKEHVLKLEKQTNRDV